MKPNPKSPFILENTEEYVQWREIKLTKANTNKNKDVIKLKMTPPHFSGFFTENHQSDNTNTQQDIFRTDISQNHYYPINKIIEECSIDNYCLYSIDDYKNFNEIKTKQLIHALAKSCGLSKLDNNICADSDSLTSIHQTSRKGQHEYIPYTNKRLSWHTDGYYNLPENTINSMLLHCFHAADTGGESAFLDHEIVYILLRDSNPKWIEALSKEDVMTIPANILNGRTIRPEQTGPVFSLTDQGQLHMRYTARKRNIIWDNSNATTEALDYLHNLLNTSVSDKSERPPGSEFIVNRKLKAGEGIISRNILHCRSAYEDDSSTKTSTDQRLLFRGRFYDELPYR